MIQDADSVWVSVTLPLSAADLAAFCRQDTERLFRINPFIEFNAWEARGDGCYRYAGINSSQQPAFTFDLLLRPEWTDGCLTIVYLSGLKEKTRFSFEANSENTRLTITEVYRQDISDAEKQQRLGEVDRSLPVWARDLQRFLWHWKRWSNFSLWRWYITKIWLPMKPTGRRISYILLCISVVEIALILLGGTIYYFDFYP